MKKNKKRTVPVWKIMLLLVCIVLFVILLLCAQRRYKEEKEQAVLLQEEQEKEQKKRQEKAEEEQKALEQQKEEKTEEETNKAQSITITNLSAVATPVLGTNDYLLEEELGKWAGEEKLSVKEATILEALVPQSDIQSTEFYVQLGEQDSPVVLLTWHVRERMVTVSTSPYTVAEIRAGALYGDAPAVRDAEDIEGAATEGGEAADAGTEGEN